MYNEARKRATMNYDSKTYRRVLVSLRKDDDKDLIEWLEKKDSMQATVKEALYKYMKEE